MTDSRKIIKYLSLGLAILLGVLAVAGIFTVIGRSVSVVGDTWRYEPENYSEIIGLEMEIDAGEIKIQRGDRFIVVSNMKYIDVSDGKNVVIKERDHLAANYNDAFMTIYIPEDMSLTELDITVGAGTFNADTLSAERLDLEFGAGEVNIGALYATHEADIESGAGKVTVGGGRLCDLQLDMGVGELNLTSEIVGEGELNLGVGEVSITLLGKRDDYTLEMNKGVGDIRFDGESLSNGKTVGNGQNFVEINGGVGSISVEFK